MTLSYEQLSTPLTEDEALDVLIERLSELGFAATSWESGSIQLTFLRGCALLYSEATKLAEGLLKGTNNETSSGTSLTKLSKSHFQNTRTAARAYQYTVRHTVEAGEGPFSVSPGDLVATNGTYNYRLIDDGVTSFPVSLTSAAAVDLVYEAEVLGSKPATADGTITTLVTTISGVTITNPTGSLVQTGRDEESDSSLQDRNATKWPDLSQEKPEDAYVNMIRRVLPNYRVEVDASNPRGPGTVDVYVASTTGVATSGDVSTGQAEIDIYRAVTADVDVIAAPAETVNVTGTVHIDASYNTAATQAAIEQAITDYIDSIGIGGVKLDGGAQVIPEDGIKAAIRSVTGVRNVNLTTPAADIALAAPFNVPVTGTLTLTYIAV